MAPASDDSWTIQGSLHWDGQWESCVERQHIGRRMTNLQDSVKRGMDTRMPRGEGSNLSGRAVNQIESLAPNIRRPLDLLLASHDQHGKPVEGQQKVFNLCQFQIELLFVGA